MNANPILQYPVQDTKTVETPIGKLQFENGYPSKEAVTKLYDALDFQRATQAYLWSLPIVSFADFQKVQENTFRAGNGDIVVYRSYRDKLGLMASNNTTPYIVSFVNLAQTGPLVFDLLAGLNASVLDDMWQRPITDFGQTGPDKQNGGKFLIVPPGQSDPHEKRAAENNKYIVLQSPTFSVCFFFRSLEPDAAKAQEWIEGLRFYPYNHPDKRVGGKILSPGGEPWSQTPAGGLAYWQSLSEILNKEPVIERDRVMMGMLKPLGIEKGKPFNPDERQAQILTQAALVGEAMAKAITYDKRLDGAKYRPDTQWAYGLLGNPEQESEFYTQVDERAALFYGGTGASNGIMIKIPGVGQAYIMTSTDKEGNWLKGANTYRLHVPAVVPAKLFWSVTAYDNETRCFIDNDEDIADSSSMMGLRKNEDGSADIYFGPSAPHGFEKNWIPTVGGKGWFAVFRLYGPTETYFDKSWPLPDIETVQ